MDGSPKGVSLLPCSALAPAVCTHVLFQGSVCVRPDLWSSRLETVLPQGLGQIMGSTLLPPAELPKSLHCRQVMLQVAYPMYIPFCLGHKTPWYSRNLMPSWKAVFPRPPLAKSSHESQANISGQDFQASFFFRFWLYHMACGVLIPQPRIEPVSSVEVLHSKQCTTRDGFYHILSSNILGGWGWKT